MFFLVVGDVLALTVALIASLRLYFDTVPLARLHEQYFAKHALTFGVALVLYVFILGCFHLYRYAWRFASLETLWGVIAANSLGLIGFIGLQRLLDEPVLTYPVLFIFWMLSVALVGGIRILLRLASLSRNFGGPAVRILQRELRPKRVVILGEGAAGARLLSVLREEWKTPYHVIGFLDDGPGKAGTYIRGAKVLGPLNRLYELLEQRAVDEVLIALSEAGGAQIRDYVMACRKRGVPVKVVPAIRDVLAGRTVPRLADISVDDLLRRAPVCLDIAKIGPYLEGKRVLVTGAGGSIGSELCRQILPLNPEKLIMLGHGENPIWEIYQELVYLFPTSADRLRTLIASVTDETRIEQIFAACRPHIVFHAAAHKHVPIMESNVLEAAQNNVLGTFCIAEACGRHSVSRMVLISSDKAVEPCSVMGATKWLCEEIVRKMGDVFPSVAYVAVRFGNVLGSTGSVVPMFKEQIKRGGPVTVTHPDMTRYFMSIPEAVQLVLQVGGMGRSGALYLLRMGEPVKIVDLAHDMIRLCGLEPGIDVDVVYTRPRPGEKLHEHTATEYERVEPAECDGVDIVHRPPYFLNDEIFWILRQIRQMIDHGDEQGMRQLLAETVPGFGATDRVHALTAYRAADPAAGV